MPRKKLTVLASSPPAADEPHVAVWIGAGVLLALVLWLPLAFGAGRLGQFLAPPAESEDARALGNALLLTVALQALAFVGAHGAAGAAIAKLAPRTQWRHWLLIGAIPWAAACSLLGIGAGSWQAWLGLPFAAAVPVGSGWLARRFARG